MRANIRNILGQQDTQRHLRAEEAFVPSFLGRVAFVTYAICDTLSYSRLGFLIMFDLSCIG